MTDSPKIRRALISVYDKTGIVDFARALHEELGVEILSTGGTAKALTEAGVPVTPIERITGFGELLDGRVKTLHPKIHAAILADRANPDHMRQLAEHGIEPIDMVVVNLYPFQETVADPDCTFEQAIDMIDIGGVALLRAAAKNHRHVWPVPSSDEESHQQVLVALRGTGETEQDLLRRKLALRCFGVTKHYDHVVRDYLICRDFEIAPEHVQRFDSVLCLLLEKHGPARYGENPHQSAAIYHHGLKPLWLHGDKPVSLNNALDADAALGLCAELTRAGDTLCSNSPLTVLNEPSATPPSAKAATSEVWNRPMAGSSPSPASLSAERLRPIYDETVHRRHLPHIQRPGATYFVTFRTAGGSFTPPERDVVMDCCLISDGDLYCLHAAVCMPDHVHLLLTPLESLPGQWHSLSKVMHALKGNIGQLVAEHRGRPGPVLQDESFDHIVRNREDLFETLEYIQANPARARLEARGPYPWLVIEDAPDWDPLTRAAGVDLKHVLLANRPGERPWHSRLRPEDRKTQDDDAALDHASPADGSDSDRPLAGPTPEGMAVTGRQVSRVPSAVCVFIKHMNACGVGVAGDRVEAYRRAYLGDPNAAMGGVLACNFEVDAAFAAVVMETFDRFGRPLKEAGAAHAPGGFFVEVWVAPSFTDDAEAVIRGRYDPAAARPRAGEALIEHPPRKKWGDIVRLLAVGDVAAPPDPAELQYRSIAGGMLVQTPDVLGLDEDRWKVVTKRAPTEPELDDLRLAWLVCKHTRSNAISIVQGGMLIGNGAGQMSRVMSCRIATWLARENGHLDSTGDRPEAGRSGADMLEETSPVAASDAFFPFRDGVDLLIDAGVTAIIQPGGSKRDAEVIAACDERGVAMIFTGTRHFRH